MAQNNTEPCQHWLRPTLHATHINLDGAGQRLLINESSDGVVAAGNIRPYSIRDVKMPSTNLPEFESTIQVGFIVWDFRKNKFCFRRRIVNDKIEEFPWIGRDGKSVKAPIDAAIWDRVTLF